MTASLSTYRELAVLTAVRDHATHGYALAAAFESMCGMGLALKRPNTYALLERLQRKGLLALVDAEPAAEGASEGSTRRGSAGMRRGTWAVTDDGAQAIDGLIGACHDSVPDPVLPAVTLLMAGHGMSPEARAKAAALALTHIREKIERVDAVLEHAGDDSGPVALLRRHLLLDAEALEAVAREAAAPDG